MKLMTLKKTLIQITIKINKLLMFKKLSNMFKIFLVNLVQKRKKTKLFNKLD